VHILWEIPVWINCCCL